MSAAEGMFSAPKATSWAWAARSRASKAREIAPFTSGFSRRSWASLPSASSPDLASRSRRPSFGVGSSMDATYPAASPADQPSSCGRGFFLARELALAGGTLQGLCPAGR